MAWLEIAKVYSPFPNISDIKYRKRNNKRPRSLLNVFVSGGVYYVMFVK